MDTLVNRQAPFKPLSRISRSTWSSVLMLVAANVKDRGAGMAELPLLAALRLTCRDFKVALESAFTQMFMSSYTIDFSRDRLKKLEQTTHPELFNHIRDLHFSAILFSVSVMYSVDEVEHHWLNQIASNDAVQGALRRISPELRQVSRITFTPIRVLPYGAHGEHLDRRWTTTVRRVLSCIRPLLQNISHFEYGPALTVDDFYYRSHFPLHLADIFLGETYYNLTSVSLSLSFDGSDRLLEGEAYFIACCSLLTRAATDAATTLTASCNQIVTLRQLRLHFSFIPIKRCREELAVRHETDHNKAYYEFGDTLLRKLNIMRLDQLDLRGLRMETEAMSGILHGSPCRLKRLTLIDIGLRSLEYWDKVMRELHSLLSLEYLLLDGARDVVNHNVLVSRESAQICKSRYQWEKVDMKPLFYHMDWVNEQSLPTVDPLDAWRRDDSFYAYASYYSTSELTELIQSVRSETELGALSWLAN
jgi:hypothetical protein